MSTGITVTLSGTDYSEYVDLTTLTITSSVTVMTSTCDLTIMIQGQAVPRPAAGMEIIITSLEGLEFAGHIVTVTEIQNAVIQQLDYKISCRDYAFLLNRHVAFNEFSAATPGAGGGYTYDQIVETLVSQYAAVDGFNSMGVQASYDAVYTRFDYQGVSDCINQMAQQIAWAFYVDYTKTVWFYDGTTSIPTPLPNNTLAADTATTEADPFNTYGPLGIYGDLQIKEDITQLRNSIYVYGHQVTANEFITQTFTGDGSTTSFGLTYPPSQDLVDNVITTVGSLVYTNAVDLTDGTPTATVQDYTAYYNFTEQTVRFNVAPADGITVTVKYKPQLPLVNNFQDPAAQAQIALVLPTASVWEYAISDPTLSGETIGPAQARADEEMAKFGAQHISGTFTSLLHGWRAGTFFYLTSSLRFSGQFDATVMYVTKVEKKVLTHPTDTGETQPLMRSTISFSNNVYVS